MWDRETFLRTMETGAAVDIVNQRQPVFLNGDLAVVVTDSTVTAEGRTEHMRYVDVMARTGGDRRFTCMIQAGWSDMPKQYAGA